MMAKEEGDASQVNQAFGRLVAKADKATGRNLLGLLRTATGIARGVVDQWGLVHVVLGMARRHTAQHPKLWGKNSIAANYKHAPATPAAIRRLGQKS